MRLNVKNVNSGGYVDSIIIPVPVILVGFTVDNSGPAQFIQLHDAAALPAEGAVPVFPFRIATEDFLPIWFGGEGRFFPTGLVICNSSTAATKTIGGENCWFDIQIAAPSER